MKKVRLVFFAMILFLVFTVALTGCSNDTAALEKRIYDLETQIEGLKSETEKAQLEEIKAEMDFLATARDVVIDFGTGSYGEQKYVNLELSHIDRLMFESITYKFIGNDFESSGNIFFEEYANNLYGQGTVRIDVDSVFGDYTIEVTFNSKTGNFVFTQKFQVTI